MNILHDIQQNLAAPKDLNNSFGGYKYRSLEGILAALKPLLAKHSASVVIFDEMVEVGGRVYVQATAQLIDKDRKTICTTTACAREAEKKKGMDDAQITGAASSYARKYAVNGLFAIDDTKDPDATNRHGKDFTDYVNEVDVLQTPEAVKKFANDKWPEIKKNLTKEDQDNFKSYCSQIIEVMEKHG